MYYRQPRYFTNFHCIGGDCPDNCCHGWRIDWKAEEVEKLKSAPNLSQELGELIDKTFIPNGKINDRYLIKFNERGNCPCLTDDGFCKIQRELGADYLSAICMVYPRRYIYADNLIYRFCNMSCREVMGKLLNDDKALDLVNVPIKSNEQKILENVTMNTPETLKEHPELKYRGELLEFFYEIIADKKRSVEDSLILGALAAQKFSQYAEDGNYDLIPDGIAAFKKQFHDPEQLKKIAAINPNYNVKLGVLSEAYKSLLKGFLLTSVTDDTGSLNIDLYLQGEQRLAETYKDRPFYLRNIVLNLLLEFALPFKLDKSIFENYSVFVTAFALFKLIAIATSELTMRGEAVDRGSANNGTKLVVGIKLDTDSYVHKACASISRFLCHSEGNAKKLLQFLQDKQMLSPAYLALLIK